MESEFRKILWGQFGAAIDMLDNAIVHCPDDLWADRSRNPEFWYLAFHTLFWLDRYLDDSPGTFRPPPPFGLEELDPAGVMPPRPFTKAELRAYLADGRAKCRAAVEGLTDAKAGERRGLGSSTEGSFAELLLYNMRHVQHHAAQLNLILRQTIDSAPGWVARAKSG